MSATSKYVTELNKQFETGHAREHAYRPALKSLLEELEEGILAINEPKQQKWGAPDYVVTKKRKGEPIPVGYIEAKDIDVDLSKIEPTEQIKRYLKDLDNFILTNYREFRFFKFGEKVATLSIADIDDFFNNKKSIKPVQENFGQLEALLLNFFGFMGQTIKSPKELAQKMAIKAQLMRDVFKKALDDENPSQSLSDQLKAFQQILIHDMDTAQFADVYAQTITYGLFTARLHDESLSDFSRHEARELIPKSNPFLRKLFDYVCGAELEEGVKWIIDELCEVYRAADIKAILHGFGKQSGRDDPIVHFYEDFLSFYDKKLREDFGAWYTPAPVVSFIVRAIDDVLQTHFNLPDGLADTSKVKIKVESQTINPKTGKRDIIEKEVHRVQLLDVAAGTGTFTAEAIKQIHAKFEGQMGMWSNYVEQDLLPRLHGFEILMASYAICHLKIDMLLSDLGYNQSKPKNPSRVGVYLTNSLEEHHPDANTLFGSWLAAEANEASRIKRDLPIMVAYGNPPYLGKSKNKGQFIMDLMESFKKEADGSKLKERNSKWINNDYMKFIRLGSHYIEKNGSGVLAYITSNSYIDSPTFRGARHYLAKLFNHIYIIDLHGSADKKEKAPDGSPDANVFDIKESVAILIGVKTSKSDSIAQLHHIDLQGNRKLKYDFLSTESLASINWHTIQPNKFPYNFYPETNENYEVYDGYLKINEILPTNSVGIVTARDELTIQDSFDEVLKTVKEFTTLEAEKAREKFNIVKDVRDWKIELAQQDVLKTGTSTNNIRKISYRPFDSKFTYFTGKSKGFHCMPRGEVMKHMLSRNHSIVTVRQVAEGVFNHAFSGTDLVDFRCTLSNKGGAYAFPLYLYPDEKSQKEAVQGDLLAPSTALHAVPLPRVAGEDLETVHPSGRRPNLNLEIVAQIAQKLGMSFVQDHEVVQPDNSFNPLDLLDYIYAVLHSPTYREKFKEFLKIDFPRIPYPENAEIFWQLVELGRQIRQFHLLEHPALSKFITTFPQSGDCVVEKPIYENGNVRINANQYFGNVPQIAWDFYIGGYQPAQKWLKDRKGRKLSFDDIRHYQKIIIALVNTDSLMKEIDEVWKP